MKTKLKLITIGWLLAVIGFSARAQGTAFTYQGRLNSSGSPASGNYDFRFRLDADPLGNTILATAFTNAVPVTNGLFITTIDFGAGWFNGSNYWLEVDVRTNAASTYVGLTPLQPLLPTPYAIMANSASNLLGALPAAQLSGTLQNSSLPASPTFSGAVTANSFSGNGASVTGVNAASLSGLNAANFWQTGGNAGTTPGVNFIGTTDNQPLEFKVNGQRALRLEPANNGFIGDQSINVIAGSPFNFVAAGVVGATIAGGGETNSHFALGYANSATADFATVGGGLINTASGGYATVAGGVGNTSGEQATVAGGNGNTAGSQATVGGGARNTASGSLATVGGGYENLASGAGAFVGGGGDDGNNDAGNTASGKASVVTGGLGNQATTNYATVPGGANNIAGGQYSFAAGRQAQALNDGSFVWADSQSAVFASTNNDSFNVRAQGGARFVTGGKGMSVDGPVTATSFAGNGAGLTGVALLAGPNTFNGTQIITGGSVGIGTASPSTLLANTANNIYGSDGFGLSSQALGWYSTLGGYAAGFYNSWNTSAGDGVVVSIANSSARILDLLSGGKSVMAVNGNGNVGIGTSTPTKALLEVEGNVANVDQGAFEYYNISGTPAHATGSVTGQNYSIWASDRIAGSEFNAYSDARIKNIEGQSDAAADLKTLLGIKITDYTYKDTIANGNRSVKKVIAQQVESVYPQAVSKSTGEVPDIYKLATIKDGWIQLATDLKAGDRVKLIGEKEQGIYPVLAVGDGAFRTDFKPDAKKVFVYGRQVKDFRSVDYEAIAMLNVSATQELARKLDAQQAENANLQSQVTDLRSQLESLQKAVAQLATKSSGGLALNTQPQEAK